MEWNPSQHMEAVRSKRPLVHHITNYVTVNDCANICLCAGGSPVMTDAIEDVSQMVALANAVVLNIGTLNSRTVESMLVAGKAANSAGIPVILDPVGIGATDYRTSVAMMILKKVKVSVIKGNMGEMGVLSGQGGDVRGVDSAGTSADPSAVVRDIAKRWDCVAAASDKVDFVSDGERVYRLSNGDDMLGTVSGTGCMLSSVIGCYTGALGASAESVVSAITAFNVAGETAAAKCDGPGSFKVSLMDSMHSLSGDALDSKARIERLRSEHLELPDDAVQLGFGCGPDAHACGRTRLHLRPPRIGDHGHMEAVAGGQFRVGCELLHGIDLQDHLLLALVVPGIEGLLVLLLGENGAFDRGVADLGRDLPLTHLEVVPHEYHELVFLAGGRCESESHVAPYAEPYKHIRRRTSPKSPSM